MSKIVLIFPLLSVCLILSALADGGSCRTKEASMKNISSQGGEKLASGVWGGHHIRAEVKDSGAQLEFDCANGTIEQAIVLDDGGAFAVSGRFTREGPGPIRAGEDNGRPVRYVGQVKNKELTLTISDPDSKEVIGTFTLTQGNEGRIRKCL